MSNVILVGGLDVAELAFYLFAAFFLGLIFYLRREDRREGYPREEDLTGTPLADGGIFARAIPKTFTMPFGRGTLSVPNGDRDAMPENVTARTMPGTPFEPLGNPLTSGVGPAAYAMRADRPDVDMFNRPRIVPMRIAEHISIEGRDTDPRGLPIAGCDHAIAGTVRDVWVDRAEHVIRYLEVALTGGGVVLVPMPVVQVTERYIDCDAVTGAQIAGGPQLASAEQITLLEEEKVQAYFGAGYLWATPERAEPKL